MRTVIIVGKGDTSREFPEWLERLPDAEVWRLNDDARWPEARCDRMYQLHEGADGAPVDCDFLRVVHPDKRVLGRGEVRLDVEAALTYTDGRERWTDTVCWMLTDVAREVDIGCVKMLGCDLLATRLERGWELPGLMWWLGWIERDGVDVYIPEGSALAQRMGYPGDVGLARDGRRERRRKEEGRSGGFYECGGFDNG